MLWMWKRFSIFWCLEVYFRYSKFLSFLFKSSNTGIVKAHGPFREFKLLKSKRTETSDMEGIKVLALPILAHTSMDLKRKEYLYNNICLLVRGEFKDIICPKPSYGANE